MLTEDTTREINRLTLGQPTTPNNFDAASELLDQREAEKDSIEETVAGLEQSRSIHEWLQLELMTIMEQQGKPDFLSHIHYHLLHFAGQVRNISRLEMEIESALANAARSIEQL